jgi:dihydrofolate synthase/folylpolyglutamate synthase
MRFNDLQGWLRWQETLHPTSIELGLARIRAVWSQLHEGPLPFAVITVAGTNGKGSCAAMLESTYRAAGYRTACYTSPHLLRYNERIRLDGMEIDDATLCAAFERVEQSRGRSSLTYFEFGTLAALDLFIRARPDVAILEVGLGGRLDAVNILDPDVSVVTTIGLDHTAWLGETLDEIAAEKAGIFRPGRPAIVGHRSPSHALTQKSKVLGCDLLALGRDFDWEDEGTTWRWSGWRQVLTGLPRPALRGTFQLDNASAAQMALSCLSSRLPVSAWQRCRGLQDARLDGRFQVLSGEVTWILDVAHNVQAAQALADNLRSFHCSGRLLAVLGVLKDKDPRGIAEPLAEQVHSWYLGESADPRALPSADLRRRMEGISGEKNLSAFGDIAKALQAAEEEARPGDCILALGSFTTVEAALRRTHSGVSC